MSRSMFVVSCCVLDHLFEAGQSTVVEELPNAAVTFVLEEGCIAPFCISLDVIENRVENVSGVSKTRQDGSIEPSGSMPLSMIGEDVDVVMSHVLVLGKPREADR